MSDAGEFFTKSNRETTGCGWEVRSFFGYFFGITWLGTKQMVVVCLFEWLIEILVHTKLHNTLGGIPCSTLHRCSSFSARIQRVEVSL